MPNHSSTALALRAPDAPKAVKRSRAKPLVVARVCVLNPKSYARLQLATEQGKSFTATFERGHLVVSEAER